MISQVLDPKDQMRFLITASNEKGQLTKIDAKGMTGKETEQLLEQYGAQFPIKVEPHKVVNDKEAYMLVNGNKIPLDKEKANKAQKAQEQKGLLDSQKGNSRD